MLNSIIRFALKNRLITLAATILVCFAGIWSASELPIDVFPDLDRPRVVVMCEAPGLAPEEVESRVTLPLEVAINGSNGVQAVRSTSTAGMAIIYVEFDFGANIYTSRQIITERLSTVIDRMPAGVKPQLAPVSSIMGQIMVLGMWSEDNSIDPIELRSRADWILRQRLLSIPGVAQVFTMGGGKKQFQVLIDPEAMARYGVQFEEIRQAVQASNHNATGGYIDQRGPYEWLVRGIGRLQSLDDIRKISISNGKGRPISLEMVATVVEGAQIKRGDAAAFLRDSHGEFSGGPAVVLTVSKQPGADTRSISRAIQNAIQETLPTLGSGVRVESLYSQEHFIDRAIENVMVALRDGGVLVVVVLFLFLMNFRTTFISLTAIPLSLLTTILVFKVFDLSINTMTLGGMAVAVGELVDDAIVDVENIYRRLKENGTSTQRKSALQVVYEASLEVRSAIVFSTVIVCLVFLPLFALSGMEGRLFTPLGIAYVVSILSSLVVSLTVTPVLSYWLLPNSKGVETASEGVVLRSLKRLFSGVIRFSLYYPRFNLAVVAILVVLAGYLAMQRERDFLPAFNEGAVQLNILLPAGTSLATTIEINQRVETLLTQENGILHFVRRTGRAELDEHAEPVSSSEYILELNPHSILSREKQLQSIRDKLAQVPGIVFSVEQPISHLISHMLSGVKAQVGIKLFGDDLDLLRSKANEAKQAISQISGVKDLLVEQQVLIPQLTVEYKRSELLLAGLHVDDLNALIETAINGQVVSEILDGQRAMDLVVRMMESKRQDIEAIRRLPVHLPNGGTVALETLASINETLGPNTIQREKVKRRIVIQCNVAQRGLVEVVGEIQSKLKSLELPQGYYFEYSGQFESQQRATQWILWIFVASLIGVFLALYTMFRSVNLALQVMAAIPMAFIGSVTALVLTDQRLTIASMVGFISLGGIASRNGILLLQHYLHLVKHEGEEWSQDMILRAGLERLAPVLMTALTAGIGLFPLVVAAGQPGKEILYPVATVILGGVFSSTLLDFFVHPAMFWLFGLNSARRVVQLDIDGSQAFAPNKERKSI